MSSIIKIRLKITLIKISFKSSRGQWVKRDFKCKDNKSIISDKSLVIMHYDSQTHASWCQHRLWCDNQMGHTLTLFQCNDLDPGSCHADSRPAGVTQPRVRKIAAWGSRLGSLASSLQCWAPPRCAARNSVSPCLRAHIWQWVAPGVVYAK